METQEQVEGWVPGDAVPGGPETPVEAAEAEPDPDASGRFVILRERALVDMSEEVLVEGDDRTPLAAFVPLVEVHGKGQADAMRTFLADEKRLADLGVHEGDVLAAVPLRSWQPKPVRARGFVWG